MPLCSNSGNRLQVVSRRDSGRSGQPAQTMIRKTMRIGEVRTSIKLEPEFWGYLKEGGRQPHDPPVAAGQRCRRSDAGPDQPRLDAADLLPEMGIPFTHVDTSDSVEGWKARDIPSLGDIRSLGLITLGRFRSSTRGLAAKRRAVSISGGFAGRMALSAPTARPWASRGECRAACCAVEPAIGRYR